MSFLLIGRQQKQWTKPYGYSSSLLLKRSKLKQHQQYQYNYLIRPKRIEVPFQSNYYDYYSTLTFTKKMIVSSCSNGLIHHHHKFVSFHPDSQYPKNKNNSGGGGGGRLRYLSNSNSSVLPKGACPFKLLQIPKDCEYKIVKTKFLKIAMLHHPDQIKNQYSHLSMEKQEEQMKKSTNLFMKARAAFDAIVEGNNGLAVLRSEVETSTNHNKKMSNDEFDAWFLNETGHSNPFQVDLDPATMREVAEMTDDIGGGLDRDGGMWTLAKMVSNTVKSGQDAKNMLRLEAGSSKREEEIPPGQMGKLRRRRKFGR